MVLVGSMSSLTVNKGLISRVYNSSKAAVIQLGCNLAMEWGKRGIGVNTLCPGHVLTPMVERHFAEEPELLLPTLRWRLRRTTLSVLSSIQYFRPNINSK